MTLMVLSGRGKEGESDDIGGVERKGKEGESDDIGGAERNGKKASNYIDVNKVHVDSPEKLCASSHDAHIGAAYLT
jgi:hypothetical protein